MVDSDSEMANGDFPPKSPLWARSEVASRILSGETLFIYRGFLIRVPSSWMNQHPGGALAILHFVGRDATDEVEAFHPDATLERIRKYSVGRVELGENGMWKPFVPPVASGWVRRLASDGRETWARSADIENLITPKVPRNVTSFTSHNYAPSEILLVEKSRTSAPTGTCSPDASILQAPSSVLPADAQNNHAESFRVLHQKIKEAGLFETPYLTGYGPEVLRYLLLAAASYFAYRYGWFIMSAVFLGLLWHQLTFIAHDLGHMGVTHNWVWDRLMGILLADFIGGLSIGWWVDVSNRSVLFPLSFTHALFTLESQYSSPLVPLLFLSRRPINIMLQSYPITRRMTQTFSTSPSSPSRRHS